MNYYFGEGVPQDYAAAARLFREAAEGGHAKAQYELGVCYRDGRGISEAYMLYRLATNNPSANRVFGEDDFDEIEEKIAGNLGRIPALMTAGEITEGERCYRKFRAKH